MLLSRFIYTNIFVISVFRTTNFLKKVNSREKWYGIVDRLHSNEAVRILRTHK